VSAAVETTSLAKVEQAGALARADEDGISVERIIARVKKIRQIRDEVMRPDVHFGKIPGVKKDSLLKPGAETLCMAFGLSPKFKFDEHREGEHLECIVTCTLFGPNGNEVGDGIGSCSTRESKYAFRNGERACPECGSTALLKSKKEPEFFCWAKKGGCGKTFPLTDKRITDQVVGRVANPDIADQYNTVRKMACKRAHVAATLFVTGASELFTQDVEDMPQHQRRVEHHDDEERDAKPGNGKPAPRASAGSKPPPTEEDFDIAVLDIRRAKTTDELQATGQKYRDKGWTPGHRKALKEAIDARLAQLKDPEYREEEESDGPPDDGEKAPW
jgi:hypothetical protein